MAFGISPTLADKTGVGARVLGPDVHVMVGVTPATARTAKPTLITTDPAKIEQKKPTGVGHTATLANNPGSFELTNLVEANLANMLEGDRISIEGLTGFPDGVFADIKELDKAGGASKIDLLNARDIFGRLVKTGVALKAGGAQGDDVVIRHIPFVALPRETTSGLTIDTRTSSVEEKPPFASDRPVPGLDQENVIARSWSVTVSLNEAKDSNELLDQLLEIGMTSKEPTVYVRVVKNEKFRGWSGRANVSVDGSPSEAGAEGAVQTSLTFRGVGYLFRSDNVE